jgi:hypothetical protein
MARSPTCRTQRAPCPRCTGRPAAPPSARNACALTKKRLAVVLGASAPARRPIMQPPRAPATSRFVLICPTISYRGAAPCDRVGLGQEPVSSDRHVRQHVRAVDADPDHADPWQTWAACGRPARSKTDRDDLSAHSRSLPLLCWNRESCRSGPVGPWVGSAFAQVEGQRCAISTRRNKPPSAA